MTSKRPTHDRTNARATRCRKRCGMSCSDLSGSAGISTLPRAVVLRIAVFMQCGERKSACNFALQSHLPHRRDMRCVLCAALHAAPNLQTEVCIQNTNCNHTSLKKICRKRAIRDFCTVHCVARLLVFINLPGSKCFKKNAVARLGVTCVRFVVRLHCASLSSVPTAYRRPLPVVDGVFYLNVFRPSADPASR
ncbi:hypothetical protein LMG31884_41620 [Xanthomonas hydrangeae]|nr:hypothetical protein LMG31884_41620 [Xanthomonas hydrangeae]CAD7727963.1 hypothetical protein LMG31884_41620 [Xanthomonas hydrangeae]